MSHLVTVFRFKTSEVGNVLKGAFVAYFEDKNELYGRWEEHPHLVAALELMGSNQEYHSFIGYPLISEEEFSALTEQDKLKRTTKELRG
ncbi:hypothetical protein D3C87_1197280 [compost metagenome]